VLSWGPIDEGHYLLPNVADLSKGRAMRPFSEWGPREKGRGAEGLGLPFKGKGKRGACARSPESFPGTKSGLGGPGSDSDTTVWQTTLFMVGRREWEFSRPCTKANPKEVESSAPACDKRSKRKGSHAALCNRHTREAGKYVQGGLTNSQLCI